MKLIHLALCLAALFGAQLAQADATTYPLTIKSCNRDVTFTQAPKHAVSHDINMTQMMLALGLKPRMAGYRFCPAGVTPSRMARSNCSKLSSELYEIGRAHV